MTSLAPKRLNDAMVEGFPHKKGKRYRVPDAYIKGLFVLVGAYSKTWVYRTRYGYRSLGRYPVMTTEQARLMVNNQTAGGSAALPNHFSTSEPINKAAVMAFVPSLLEVLEKYTSTRQLSTNTIKDMRTRIGFFKQYLDKPINTLTPSVFMDYYETQKAKGANHENTGRYLRALFRWAAVAYELPNLPDPTQRMRALTGEGLGSRAKDSRLTRESVASWWRAVGGLPKDVAFLLKAYLLTGARKSEMLGLNGADVMPDGVDRVVLTFRQTKNGSDHSVYCGTRLTALGNQQGWVMPNPSRLRRATEQLREKLGADNVTIHDLRRSFASFAHEAGVDMPTLKAMMNHAPAVGDTTTRHYLRITPDAMRAGFQMVEDFIMGLVEKE